VAVDAEQERLSAGVGPVVVEVSVAVLTVDVDVGGVERRKVVTIKLDKAPQHWPIGFGSWEEFKIHRIHDGRRGSGYSGWRTFGVSPNVLSPSLQEPALTPESVALPAGCQIRPSASGSLLT